MDAEELLRRLVDSPTPPEFCLAGISHWSTCMTKSEWAAWATAILTAAAIAGTVVATYMQVRAIRRERIEAEADRVELRANLIAITVDRIDQWLGCWVQQPGVDVWAVTSTAQEIAARTDLLQCAEVAATWRMDTATVPEELLAVAGAGEYTGALREMLQQERPNGLDAGAHNTFLFARRELQVIGDVLSDVASRHRRGDRSIPKIGTEG